MKRDELYVERDEAKVIAYLNRIRDGRTVCVSYVQHPWSAVCHTTGKWGGQDPPIRVGWMVVNRARARAIIMPTDKITLFVQRHVVHVTVHLAGRRIPRLASTVRRARIAGLLDDQPAGGAS